MNTRLPLDGTIERLAAAWLAAYHPRAPLEVVVMLQDAIRDELPGIVLRTIGRSAHPPREAGIRCCPTCHRWRSLAAEPECRECEEAP